MTPRLVQRDDATTATLLIRGARVLDPAEAIDATLDVRIVDGVIAELGSDLASGDGETIEAAGATLMPGFVDPHVHLRSPGQEHKEDIASGTAAGAAGGYVALLAMPNTDPPIDDPALLDALFERAAAEAVIPVGFVPAISLGLAGQQLTEMGAMVERGAAGFTDDGKPVVSAGLLRRALQYVGPLGVPLALHCEEPSLSRGGHMHEGRVSAELGIAGYPAIAESVMVARDVRIAAYERGRIHIQHVSTAASVDEIGWARARQVAVTAEASPHHLLLTDDAVRDLDPATAKMNPPLAAEEDRRALIAAVRDGLLDVIATDHAPHAPLEKEVPFEEAPNGVIGLETAFAAILTDLVRPGLLPLTTVVTRMTAGPAAAFGLDRPRIAGGVRANVTLFDLDGTFEVREDGFRSKSRNCAFLGRTLSGRCLLTVAGGAIAHRAAVEVTA